MSVTYCCAIKVCQITFRGDFNVYLMASHITQGYALSLHNGEDVPSATLEHIHQSYGEVGLVTELDLTPFILCPCLPGTAPIQMSMFVF